MDSNSTHALPISNTGIDFYKLTTSLYVEKLTFVRGW